MNLRIALRALPTIAALVAVSPGSVSATTGIVPVGWPGAVPVAAAGDRQDIARTAVALVPESAREVRLLFDETDAAAVARAGLLVDDAAAVGITLVPIPGGRGGYDDDLAARRFEAALVTISPTVADGAELPRLWALTDGFAGGWSPTIGSEAFRVIIEPPARGPASTTAEVGFEDAIRRDAFVVPLVSYVHRVGVRTGVPGVEVGVVGNVPLERIGPAERQG